mmetsp:Transcript_62719/g.204716  ORF Transcript_62719/g.204716 Transcript_62719/m.204716 type:complete len:311 (+) Transcript_62719:218-1150(+)
MGSGPMEACTEPLLSGCMIRCGCTGMVFCTFCGGGVGLCCTMGKGAGTASPASISPSARFKWRMASASDISAIPPESSAARGAAAAAVAAEAPVRPRRRGARRLLPETIGRCRISWRSTSPRRRPWSSCRTRPCARRRRSGWAGRPTRSTWRRASGRSRDWTGCWPPGRRRPRRGCRLRRWSSSPPSTGFRGRLTKSKGRRASCWRASRSAASSSRRPTAAAPSRPLAGAPWRAPRWAARGPAAAPASAAPASPSWCARHPLCSSACLPCPRSSWQSSRSLQATRLWIGAVGVHHAPRMPWQCRHCRRPL